MSTKISHSARQKHQQTRKAATRKLLCERLEERTLPTIWLNGVPDWIEQGPGPITGGQVEGLDAQNNPVAGAIEAIAAHPFDANILYAGAANGGIWWTYTANFPNDGTDNDGDGDTDEGDENPIWYPLTDELPSLAIGAIAFSPLDASNNTLFAGTGDFRSGRGTVSGGRAIGVLKTTDGGTTWDVIGPELTGFRIRSIVPTAIGTPDTQVVLVAAVNNGGVFRSVDGGRSFNQISGKTAPTDGMDNDVDGATDEPGEGDGLDNDGDGATDEPNELTLPAGSATHLVRDPGNPNRFYAAIPGSGVFRTDNAGVSWQLVNSGLGNATVNVATATRMELAVSPVGPNPVYAALISPLAVPPGTPLPGPTLNGLFRSLDLGVTWTALDLPQTTEGGTTVGLHPASKPGQQGGVHFSMLADSNNANVLFVGGDRQPGSFPNSIGCEDFSGRHFRGNASLAAGTQFAPINCDNASGTSPHADSRDMVFDANGNIIESDDGGIYRLVNPNLTNRRWVSLNGNIRVTEFYSVAYDPVNHAVIGGAQDVGVSEQNAPDNFTWRKQTKADGGFVAAATGLPGQDALRFFSTQNLGGFARAEFDDENQETGQEEVELNVVGTGNNLFRVEYATGGCGPPPPTGTIQFIQPYVLNTVWPDQILIGTNYLYEAVGRGDQVTALGGVQSLNSDATDNDCDGTVDEDDEFGPLNPIGQVTAMSYGGRRNGEDAGDVIYVGTQGGSIDGGVTNGTLFLRTSNNTDSLADFVTLTNYGLALRSDGLVGGTTPLDIALDPDDWQRGYLIDANNRVWRFVNAGNLVSDWSDITSNLPQLSTNLRTIEVFRNTAAAGDEVVLVGGDGGVFRTLDPDGPEALWTEFGANLPNVVATDLHYVRRFDPNDLNDPRDDLLVVGTLGRGAWTIPGASDEIVTPGDLQIDGFNLTVFDDTFRLVLDEHNPLILNVFVNNNTPVPTLSLPLAALQTIHINGFAGNDTLIVDFVNGNPIPIVGLEFKGDIGPNDRVQILGRDEAETFTLDAAGNRSGVRVDGPTMPYVAALSVEAENLEIQALGGSDTFDIEGTSASLTLLTLNGGPSLQLETDTFNLSPQAMTLDNIDGNLHIEGSGGIDRLSINDQNNAGNHTYTLTDTTFDRTGFPLLTYIGFFGHVSINTASADGIVNVESRTMGHTTITAGAGDDTFNVTGVFGDVDNPVGRLTVDGATGTDRLFVTEQLNDDRTYRLTAETLSTGGVADQIAFSSIRSVTLTTGDAPNTFSIQSTSYDLTINAGAEDDSFYVSSLSDLLDDIDGDLTVNGGDGLNLLTIYDQANDSNHDYVIQDGTLARSEYVWGLNYSLIDSLTLNAGGGDSIFSLESSEAGVTVRAGDGTDRFIVTRPGELAEIGADLTLDGQGESDTLEVYDQGHDDAETYTITRTTFSRTATDFTIEYIAVESMQIESGDGGSTFDINSTHRDAPITINAGDGADTFRVNAPPRSELTLNGESPFARPGDTLVVTGADGNGIYEPGDLSGSGTITVDGETINFTGLEPITVSGFQNFSMVTPGVTDQLSIDTPTPCVTRVSGTSSGAAFESLAWFNVTSFVLSTGRGDDTISIQETACSSQVPNDANEFRIDAGGGDDVIRIAWVGSPSGLPGRVITLIGGSSFTGDALMIAQDESSGPLSYRQGLEAGTGAINVGSQRLAVFAGIELVENRTGGSDIPAVPTLTLDPASDSGVTGVPESFSDRITNVSRPIFRGTAEPNSIVRLFGMNASGAALLLGETATGPATMTSPFEAPWSLATQVDLNDLALGFATPDGMRHLTATAEDWAGNVSPPASLDIWLDTQGPWVNAVERLDGVNVVGQEAFGPAPLIAGLDVTFFDADLPPSEDSLDHPAVWDSLARDATNFFLVGERVGQIAIESVEVIATGTATSAGGGFGSVRSGAIIIDGSDRDEHGARTSAANVGGWKWIEQVVRFAYTATSNSGVGVLVIGASGRARDAISSVTSVLGIPATYITASQIVAVDFSQFRLVYVPSDATSIPGGISDADLALLGTRRPDIESFVNNGGSLVALTESEAAAPYQWLGLPSFDGMIGSGSSTGRLYQMPALAAAGLTISDADLNLGIPWHHHFDGSSSFAGLVPFARSVGPDGIAGNGDDHIVTLGLAPASGGGKPEAPGRTTTVRLNFDRPLADDRYLFIVTAGITDGAGNGLLNPPPAPPTEQVSGTNPLLRFPFDCAFDPADFTVTTDFTVDSRVEIGTFYQGSWYIDLNGNGLFDPSNNGGKNHDVVLKFGRAGDRPVVGDWDDDGFDEIGVFGMRGDMASFQLDTNGNGTFDPLHGDVSFDVDPFLVGGIRQPVAGDFNPAVPGDELALLRGDTWLVDLNGNHQFGEPGETILTNFRGQPIAANWGDFPPEGIDHLGTYDDGLFQFDMDGDFQFLLNQDLVEIDFQFPGGQPAVAVTGDWDADGNDNIGLFVTDRDGVVPREAAEWYLDVGYPNDNAFPGDGAFQPPPLGRPGVPADQQDIFYQFGDGLALPVVGNFDPPARGVAPGRTQEDGPGSIELVQTPMRAPSLSGDDHANRAGPRASHLTWIGLSQVAVDSAIETRGDRDVFQFTATQTGRIAIDMTTPFSNLDPSLTLLNAKRRRVASNDNFAAGTDSHIEFDGVSGETYYVVAEGKRRSRGRYELSVDYLLAGDPTATFLEPDTAALEITGELSQASPAHFYRFIPSVTEYVEIRTGGLVDSVLDLYDSTGRVLAHNDNTTENETGSRVAMQVTAGQTYFIRVRGRSDGVGQYELAVDTFDQSSIPTARMQF